MTEHNKDGGFDEVGQMWKQSDQLVDCETTLDWEGSMGNLYRRQSTIYQQFDSWPREKREDFPKTYEVQTRIRDADMDTEYD